MINFYYYTRTEINEFFLFKQPFFSKTFIWEPWEIWMWSKLLLFGPLKNENVPKLPHKQGFYINCVYYCPMSNCKPLNRPFIFHINKNTDFYIFDYSGLWRETHLLDVAHSDCILLGLGPFISLLLLEKRTLL